MQANDGSILLKTVLYNSIEYQSNILSEKSNNCKCHRQLVICLGLVTDCMPDSLH